MAYSLKVNGKAQHVEVAPGTPLLWVLRDTLGMTGTKFGCGVASCGACTVHVNGVAQRSCSVPIETVNGASVTTIEGLSAKSDHPLQKAWIAEQVPQCGYCQSGMLMAAAALLKDNPKPTAADIDTTITNICRCGTYNRVRKAIQRASGQPTADATSTINEGRV
jgi:aerobic-type carbon monoxide dehydrogenase small subunit (CoxS/CutS family)